MEGYEVVTMEEAVKRADIFVTATGNVDVITVDYMRAMMTGPSFATSPFRSRNSGRRPEELQMEQHQGPVDEIEFPGGNKIILLSQAAS